PEDGLGDLVARRVVVAAGEQAQRAVLHAQARGEHLPAARWTHRRLVLVDPLPLLFDIERLILGVVHVRRAPVPAWGHGARRLFDLPPRAASFVVADESGDRIDHSGLALALFVDDGLGDLP